MTRPGPQSAATVALPRDHTPGQICGGRYRLDDPLGSGGVGAVWAATHVITGKRVALKLLRHDVMGNPDVRRRFVREARAACAINHPNVIQVHDIIEPEAGPPFLVMDLLEGETLARKLEREQRIELTELVSLLLPVISAVSAAHARGILHRDLKPENIFLCAGGPPERAVRVLDFGLAKLAKVASQSAAITETGDLLGSPYYMAPEQVYGERDVDARVDIWSLGVILYECLSGERPTEAVNVGQVLKRITTGNLLPLREVAPWLPAEICELVDGMLRVDRGARVSEITAVRAVLERHCPGTDLRRTTQLEGTWSKSVKASRRGFSGALVALATGALIAGALAISAPRLRSVETSSLAHEVLLARVAEPTVAEVLPMDSAAAVAPVVTRAPLQPPALSPTTPRVPSRSKKRSSPISASSAPPRDLFAGPD